MPLRPLRRKKKQAAPAAPPDPLREALLGHTSMPPAEFDRTHVPTIRRAFEAYAPLPEADALSGRLVQALALAYKRRRAYILPRFADTDDSWRMRECVTYAVGVAVCVDHLSAYLRLDDAARQTPVAALWHPGDPVHGDTAGAGRALAYHLLVPYRGRRWIASEPEVGRMLAQYYTGEAPNELDDIVAPVMALYLPGGRYAVAVGDHPDAPGDSPADDPPTPATEPSPAALDAVASLSADAAADPAVRALAARHDAASAARRLAPASAGAAAVDAIARRLEPLADSLAAAGASLDELTPAVLAGHLRERAATHSAALAAAVSDRELRTAAERDAFLDARRAEHRDRIEALRAECDAARMLLPADARTELPPALRPPAVPPHPALAVAAEIDLAAALAGPHVPPAAAERTGFLLRRAAPAAGALGKGLLDLVPADLAPVLEDIAAEHPQDVVDQCLDVAEALLVHYARTLRPQQRLPRPLAAAALPAARSPQAAAATAALHRLGPAVGHTNPARLNALLPLFTAFAAFAARHGRSLDDATPALALAYLEEGVPKGIDFDAARDAVEDYLVHVVRSLHPAQTLAPVRRPESAVRNRKKQEKQDKQENQEKQEQRVDEETRARHETPTVAQRGDADGPEGEGAAPSPPTRVEQPELPRAPRDPPPDGPAPEPRPAEAAQTPRSEDPAPARTSSGPPDPSPPPPRGAQPDLFGRPAVPTRAAPRRGQPRPPDSPPLAADVAAAFALAPPPRRPGTARPRSLRRRVLAETRAISAAPEPVAVAVHQDVAAGSQSPVKRPHAAELPEEGPPRGTLAADADPFRLAVPIPAPAEIPDVDLDSRTERRLYPKRARRPFGTGTRHYSDFLDYLAADLASGRLTANAADSLVHTVRGGSFLVVPQIFAAWAAAAPDAGVPPPPEIIDSLEAAALLARNPRRDLAGRERHLFHAMTADDVVRTGIVMPDRHVWRLRPRPEAPSPWLYPDGMYRRKARRPAR